MSFANELSILLLLLLLLLLSSSLSILLLLIIILKKSVSPVDVHVLLLKLKLKCVTSEQCEFIKFCLNFSGQTPSIDTLAMEHRVNIQLKR